MSPGDPDYGRSGLTSYPTSELEAPPRWANGNDGSKRLVQCPGCWTAAMARKDVDWECECGELMTVVDLREASNQETRVDG